MNINGKDLGRILRDYMRPWLTGSEGITSNFYKSIPEIYPVNFSKSATANYRLNILIPTASPKKIYGGVSTALEVAKKIIDEFQLQLDIRIIITSDEVDSLSVDEISRRLGRTFVIGGPNEDVGGNVVAALYERRGRPISIRRNDIFLATAWWTADLGFRLQNKQDLLFNYSYDLIYLIQDFEPGFYSWSNHYALSESTYLKPKTLALINSEELFDFLIKRYKFKEVHLIPYRINSEVAKNISVRLKEKIILVYGRPTVSRNCFRLIVEGIRLWQLQDPLKHTEYKIKFVGESFEESRISELENSEVLGKLGLGEYGNLLSRSAIGISLMISPHPSYPPLEMAYAGCITVSNCYENKNLSSRSKNILSIKDISPASLAHELNNAVLIFNEKNNKLSFLGEVFEFSADLDYKKVVSSILNDKKLDLTTKREI